MLAAHFIRRGYPLALLEETLTKVASISRSSALDLDYEGVPNMEDEADLNKSGLEAFSITTYNPSGNPNKTIIQNNWGLLGKSNTTKFLYEHRVIHGHRCPANLRDMLVNAKLPLLNSNRGTQGHSQNACETSQCIYCPKMNKTGWITVYTRV